MTWSPQHLVRTLICSAALSGILSALAAEAQTAPLPPGTSETAAQAGAKVGGQLSVDQLTAAEAKLEQKDYAGAKALLATYLAAHPDNARALFDEGYLEDAEDHPVPAESNYRKAIAADPQQFESRLALGLLLAGRNARSAGETAEARTQLEAATRLAPNPANPAAVAQAHRALARLLGASDPEAARQALLAALKLSPETLADTLLTAQIAEAADDPETAEAAYRAVLAASPSNSASDPALQATTGLAHLLITAKKYADAEPLLRKALAQRSGDPVLNSQLAELLVAEGKSEDAAAVLETLHASHPEDRNVSRMLADLDTESGQAVKAEPLYVQLLTAPGAPPPDAGLLAARGDNLVRQQRFADAVPVLEQATKLDPENGDAWSALAFAASENHQAQLTLDSLSMRSKVMAETPATYFLAATAWDTLHVTKRAIEMYKQFLAVAGGNFPDQEWQAKHRLVALSR